MGMDNTKLIEEVFFKQLIDYVTIKGIKDGDIGKGSIKKYGLENFAKIELTDYIEILGKYIKIFNEEKINNILKDNGSKKQYFYFPENNFVYGNVEEFDNNNLIVDPEIRTTNLIKSNFYYFEKNNKSYIIKTPLDYLFECIVEEYEKSNRIGKALSTIGINSIVDLIKSEKKIKHNIYKKIFNKEISDKDSGREPVILFEKYLKELLL